MGLSWESTGSEQLQPQIPTPNPSFTWDIGDRSFISPNHPSLLIVKTRAIWGFSSAWVIPMHCYFLCFFLQTKTHESLCFHGGLRLLVFWCSLKHLVTNFIEKSLRLSVSLSNGSGHSLRGIWSCWGSRLSPTWPSAPGFLRSFKTLCMFLKWTLRFWSILKYYPPSCIFQYCMHRNLFNIYMFAHFMPFILLFFYNVDFES